MRNFKTRKRGFLTTVPPALTKSATSKSVGEDFSQLASETIGTIVLQSGAQFDRFLNDRKENTTGHYHCVYFSRRDRERSNRRFDRLFIQSQADQQLIDRRSVALFG